LRAIAPLSHAPPTTAGLPTNDRFNRGAGSAIRRRPWSAPRHRREARVIALLKNTIHRPQSRRPTDSKRRVRVLFINDTSRNGGPGRSLFSILKFLDPERIHRAVLLPRPGIVSELLEPVADEMFFLPTLVENPIEPVTRAMERADFDAPAPLKALRAVASVGKGAIAIAQLTEIARRGRFDLLYCNGTNADFAGGAVAWASGVPALWHVRYTSLPPAVMGVHDRLAASAGVARIVCVSHAAAALFGHCPNKVRVINNALDTREFARGVVAPLLRTELGLGADVVIFGSQGRILPRKGYAEMVRAAKLALDAMSEGEKQKVHFAVLGDTPEDIAPDHLAECRELANSLGIANRFTFLGFRADVRPYVADFDVAVVPSVYADPLPRAVIETMAFGMPVLAFDVGGVAEMLADGETGALVSASPPDVQGLATQMLRYLRDPELRARQGLAARARIEARFDARAHASAIQEEIVRTAGWGSE
jgi:glycosyltransferase involved in cell wall biosynthesis